jgi:hypothetical protein
MDKTALVERGVDDGRKLLEALDSAGFQVSAALWFYVSDADEWRLMIASPLVDEKGPRKAYTFIQSVLAGLSPLGISLRSISVVSPHHEVIQLLKGAIRNVPGRRDVRVTRNAVNNVFIEDAYIYHMPNT